MREETAQSIIAAGEIGAKYDSVAKNLWHKREILAPLLKYAVKELEEESVETIMGLIDADSIKEDMPVSDLPADINRLDTEETSLTEKTVSYDCRFVVKNPKLSDEIMMVVLHFDMEFQNKYRPTLSDGRSYPMIKRGIYYAAREISSQLNYVTEQTNYSDVSKVISIWIINDDSISLDLQNTATRYCFTKEEGQNQLVEAFNRLQKGESREDIIKSGIDEHTVDLAMTLRK